jgi:HK97 family phage major capsid protein
VTSLLTREHRLERAEKAEDGGLIIDLAMASELPYERWWGIEVLRVGPDNVRLGRLNDGASVLFNHNSNDLRGVHVQGGTRIDGDKVLRGKVRIETATQTGRDTAALVDSGILTKSSVGYMIHNVIEKTKTKDGKELERKIDGPTFERTIRKLERSGNCDRTSFIRELDRTLPPIDARSIDDVPTYYVVDWEPFENSFVTIPADPTVGVGRFHDIDAREERASPDVSNPAITAATSKVGTMTEATTAAAGESADRLSAVDAEKERRTAIINLCKSNRIDPRVEARWIEDGTPLTKIASEILDVMEERGRQKPAGASAIGLSSKESNRYSVFKVIRALQYGGKNPRLIEDAAFEIECSRAVGNALGRADTTNILIPGEILTRPMDRSVMERAMATTPGSKGGYMVSVENMGFIDILRNRSVAMRMGARQISGLVGNVSFARQTGKATVTWQGGEGTSTTATDQALGQLSMTPKTAIAITDVSEQLLRQSTPSAEQFVMADLAADIAIDGVDNAVINGAGGSQPLGIKNTTGVTTGQDSATATYAKILAFISAAGSVNAIRGNPGFVTNITGATTLMQRQRFTSTDTPLWEGNALDGQLVKFNAMSSEQLAANNLIFGSWDEVVVGDWGVLELSTDNGGTRFNQAQVGIRALWMVDVLVRYPQAFVVSVNLS